MPDRARHLLKFLVEGYIRECQPVGSRTLTEASGLGLSSATVRNIVADLEEEGYVSAPHTSAGRMPTVRGYRFFVDALLTVQPLESAAIERLRTELSPDLTTRDLIQSASSLLASITAQAGLVTVPRHNQSALDRKSVV